VSDFPGNPVTPLHIGTYSRESVGRVIGKFAGAAAPVSASWQTANLAYIVPLQLSWPYPLVRFWWGNGSAAGNMDVGIYTRGGARIASTGATAQTPASNLQYAAPSSGTILLDPGSYLLAISNNGTTNRGWGTANVSVVEGRILGLYSMASAHALPASLTLAIPATAFLPFFGITRTASGF
jgi:hypothetical protein